MRNRHFLKALSHYHELSPREQEALWAHVAECPKCARAWEAYQSQDRLLGTLRSIEPSPALRAAVMSRTIHADKRRASVPRFAYTFAAVLLALVITMGGTVTASAGSLPGDMLYSVKRATEQVQLGLTFDQEAREELVTRFAAKRRDEVRQVVEMGRTAEVEFEGRVEEVHETSLVVDGLLVEVSETVASQAAAVVGRVVKVEAMVADGAVTAAQVRVQEPDSSNAPAPSDTPVPADTPVPDDTPVPPTATASNTAKPAPTDTPRPADTDEPEQVATDTPRPQQNVPTASAGSATPDMAERVQTKQVDLRETRNAMDPTETPGLNVPKDDELVEPTATPRARQTATTVATPGSNLVDPPTETPTPTWTLTPTATQVVATPTPTERPTDVPPPTTSPTDTPSPTAVPEPTNTSAPAKPTLGPTATKPPVLATAEPPPATSVVVTPTPKPLLPTVQATVRSTPAPVEPTIEQVMPNHTGCPQP